jgi:hypothetical protein
VRYAVWAPRDRAIHGERLRLVQPDGGPAHKSPTVVDNPSSAAGLPRSIGGQSGYVIMAGSARTGLVFSSVLGGTLAVCRPIE